MRKYSRNLIPVLCVTLCLAALSCKKSGEKPAGMHEMQVNEGAASAEMWIKLVDSEKYSDSWSSASVIFRNSVAKDKWVEKVSGVRKPIGKVISRNTASKEFQTSLPGVPDGEYVVIKYRSVFEKKKTTVELVTSAKDPDGVWRVAGYFVK